MVICDQAKIAYLISDFNYKAFYLSKLRHISKTFFLGSCYFFCTFSHFLLILDFMSSLFSHNTEMTLEAVRNNKIWLSFSHLGLERLIYQFHTFAKGSLFFSDCNLSLLL